MMTKYNFFLQWLLQLCVFLKKKKLYATTWRLNFKNIILSNDWTFMFWWQSCLLLFIFFKLSFETFGWAKKNKQMNEIYRDQIYLLEMCKIFIMIRINSSTRLLFQFQLMQMYKLFYFLFKNRFQCTSWSQWKCLTVISNTGASAPTPASATTTAAAATSAIR